MYNGWNMFPDKKALVTGIILCGFGFASLIFGITATKIANPDNLSLEDPALATYLLYSFPLMLHILCVVWAILALAGTVLLFPAPYLKS